MHLLRQRRWTCRGFSLLWEPTALASIANPEQVVSMRQLFALRNDWPEELPAGGGDALVVAGLEGCLDALEADDAVTWLESDLKSVVLDFQEYYTGDAALILWLPSGSKRIRMLPATEQYTWSLPAPHADRTIDLGRCLWAGAETDVARILDSDDPNADYDGPAWVGLHHPRIS